MSIAKLDLSVALKLAFVEDSLAKVEQYRHQLQKNARKVKEEIHEVVDRQVGSLRMRERQLVRQVEVVTAHETCRLGTQQARLMHSKGALTATSDLLDHCADSESNTLAKIKVDEMFSPQEVQPAKQVSVQLDETDLTSAISQFGSVQLPDSITHHPSPVIPVKVEEYEDEEHDVLHKSVACAASEPSAPMHIKVQFPRLANHSWLFKQNGSSSSAFKPPKTIVTQETKSSDVVAWLGDLKLSTALPEEDSSVNQCDDGFDLVGTPTTSEGSSIEIVHFLDKECSSPGSALCEIENAHDLINDKSRWLSSRTPEQPNEEKLDVSSACMANETCQSFKDCLCQNKCRENALEKLQQTADFKAKTSRKRTFSEAEGIQAVLTHMVKILSSENSQWLLKKHGGELPRPPKCVMYNSPGDTWLRQCSDSPTKTFPRAHLSSHCNTWLLKHLKNQKNAQEKDEKEKEKYTDEKDNRITSEALSEALKRVCIDPAKRKCLGDESNLYSCSASLTFSDQPWLLARKCDTNKLTSKDQWQEKDKTCKPQWLSSSRDLSPGKEASIIGLPISLQGFVSPLDSEANSWLLH
ncbi:uncharacterized protein LOC123504077 [Portunus trituberculatus]|uniref:uncharacterized protein LOC123504077 n=1 Tax=Portunus trituberculatus TaxID=210409 RepID=UPI001E1D0F90|nr:uncharacterized protein LOC123504077 [Portunus trituberculatus]XP_045110295.1 uncharacterized protein LOC123504077 [Portunus trituberculatus]XP_045110296.1 uncharacterized protein LOC123504077 [Portunus trituberculatus]